jgi:hypothetical protein
MNENQLTVSGGYTDITPSGPTGLAGYGLRRKASNRVWDNLETNAVAVRCGSAKAVFVQVDALSAGQELRHFLLDALGGEIADEELFLVASHTHSAPGIDARLPKFGEVRPDYVAEVASRTAALLHSVLSKTAVPAVLNYSERQAAHSVNRRCWCKTPTWGIPPIKRVMAIHPNPEGAKDETVRVLALMRPSQPPAPLALLWTYACHPVSVPDDRAVSADYPGVVRKALRSRFGADLPIVFLLGFSGNVRPNRTVSFPLSPYYLLHRIVNGPVFRDFTVSGWNRWTASLAGVVTAAASEGLHPLTVAGVASGRSSEPLRNLMQGELDDRPLTFQYVRLGGRCILIGVSAEMMIEYADELRKMFPNQIVVPVGCLDATFGYLPTSAMLLEGGMEVTSPGYLLARARFPEDVSERVTQRIRSLTHNT